MSKSKKKDKKHKKLLKELDKLTKEVIEIRKMDVDESLPPVMSDATPANVTAPKKNSEDSEKKESDGHVRWCGVTKTL